MDYSLLVGVHYEKQQFTGSGDQARINDGVPSMAQSCRREAAYINGPRYYYFGIIDILQVWDWRKKLERTFKVWMKQQDRYGVSAIDPPRYQAPLSDPMGFISSLLML